MHFSAIIFFTPVISYLIYVANYYNNFVLNPFLHGNCM